MSASVSVITPFFGSSRARVDLFRDCCDSIQNQSFPVNHVVIDDDSPCEEAREFLVEYASGFKNVTLIQRVANGGQAAAVMNGLEFVLRRALTGAVVVREPQTTESGWITLLDSDDLFFDRDSLSARVAKVVGHVAMVHSAMGVIRGKGNVFQLSPSAVSDPKSMDVCLREILWRGVHISYPTMLWPATCAGFFLESLTPQLKYGIDKFLAVLSLKTFLEDGRGVEYLAVPTVKKIKHMESQTGSNLKWDLDFRISQDRIIYSLVCEGPQLEGALELRRIHYLDKAARRRAS